MLKFCFFVSVKYFIFILIISAINFSCSGGSLASSLKDEEKIQIPHERTPLIPKKEKPSLSPKPKKSTQLKQSLGKKIQNDIKRLKKKVAIAIQEGKDLSSFKKEIISLCEMQAQHELQIAIDFCGASGGPINDLFKLNQLNLEALRKAVRLTDQEIDKYLKL